MTSSHGTRDATGTATLEYASKDAEESAIESCREGRNFTLRVDKSAKESALILKHLPPEYGGCDRRSRIFPDLFEILRITKFFAIFGTAVCEYGYELTVFEGDDLTFCFTRPPDSLWH